MHKNERFKSSLKFKLYLIALNISKIHAIISLISFVGEHYEQIRSSKNDTK